MSSLLILVLASIAILISGASVEDPRQEYETKLRRHTILEPEDGVMVKRPDNPEEMGGIKGKRHATSEIKVSADEEVRGEICFDELGCFTNDHPFDSPTFERIISLKPATREDIGTEFRFYSSKRSDIAQFVSNKNFTQWNIEDNGFNANSKTKFIIHGYLGGDAEWALRLKKALIEKEQCNVFIVDWSNGDGPVFEQAVANVRVVGAEIGLFIKKLMKATGLSSRLVHIIGHSLGAHGAGYAGKFVQASNPKAKIGRITGLDPAGPYFNEVEPEVRLDSGDANFVDVIHTNWAGNRISGFGLFEAIGHFDYYPHGGEDQPGCPTAGDSSLDIFLKAASYVNLPAYIYQLIKGDPTSLGDKIDKVSCSHGRAYEYFIESLKDRDCEFKSLQCFSWERFLAGECGTCRDHNCITMGYYADRYTRYAKGRPKKFYLRVAKDPPYCIEKTKYAYLVNP